MPELSRLPRVEDPLVHLRGAIAAHAAATQASIDAGAAVQQAKVEPPAAEVERPA